jgi:hypothetical protein
VTVQLNDPKIPGLHDSAGADTGRFSNGQSPDNRFSVDQDNPTVHAATGYPMCIPRTDPTVKDDPLCPQKNRPLAPGLPQLQHRRRRPAGQRRTQRPGTRAEILLAVRDAGLHRTPYDRPGPVAAGTV